jgi:hypothetical protein
MKNILVVLMVVTVLLSGCQDEKQSLPNVEGYTNCYLEENKFQSDLAICEDINGVQRNLFYHHYYDLQKGEEMRPQYREWDSQDNVILLEGLATILDRLDTIDESLEKLDFIQEAVGREVIFHWGVTHLEDNPSYWTAKVFNYSDENTVDYILTIFYEDDSTDRFVFDNLNELYDNYNYLVRAYRENE